MKLDPNTPRYLKDIDELANAMPFGELNVLIHRHFSKVDVVTITKSSQLAPKTNESAFSDLEKLINSLILASFSGKLEFELTFNKGTIRLINIKNKEIINYGNSN